MCQLDACLEPLGVDVVVDAPQRGNLAILPNARIFRRDAAIGKHSAGLENGQRSAASGHGAQVHKVPVREVAIVGRVLTHGRHDETVDERHSTHADGMEQRGDLVWVLVQLECTANWRHLSWRVERNAWGGLARRGFGGEVHGCF